MPEVKVRALLNLGEILGQKEVKVTIEKNAHIGDLLDKLEKEYGGRFREGVMDPKTKKPYPHIMILVNGRDIDFLNKLETELHDGDTVWIIPPAGGG